MIKFVYFVDRFFLGIFLVFAAFAPCKTQFIFTCDFNFKQVAESFGYTCTLIEVRRIESSGFAVEGNHLEGRSSNDVTIIDVQVLLKSFHNELFVAFRNLETIQLYRSGLELINSSDFRDAVNLRFLQIVEANIGKIHQSAFNNTRSLEVLRCISCRIETIEDGAFLGLSNLRELSIYDNKITELRSDILNPLINLRVFTASFNQIERIDGDLFQNNRRLENILFVRNRINRISSNFIDNVISLKTLALQGNLCVNRNFDVSTASDVSIIHSSLQVCYQNENSPILTSTEATTTPPTTTPPPPAQVIQLNCSFSFFGSEYTCTLQSIVLTDENADYRIGGTHINGWANHEVKTVRVLNSDVPFIIKQVFDVFRNMETLQLTNSRLARLKSSDFERADSLRNLEISGALLQSLDENSFRSLSGLQKLSIKSHSISAIHDNALANLSSLTSLELESGEISELRPAILSPLTELLTFSMANNQIKKITATTFSSNLKLLSINLDQNEIMEIEPTFIDQLQSLRIMKISQNLCADASFGSTNDFAFTKDMINYELKQCYANVGSPNPTRPEFIPLTCSFSFQSSEYTCQMQSLEVSNENAIFRVEGTHINGWQNYEVRRLRIQNSNVTFIITRLFEVFTGVTSLQLSNTLLTKIRENDFDHATKLLSMTIDRASPSLTTLDENSFRKLEQLEILQITSSYINEIHFNALRPLGKLRGFVLNNNFLTSIDRRLFANNSQLQAIEIESNKIITIERGFFQHLRQLNLLRLTSNRCADSSFGSTGRFAFTEDLIDYELKQCYANVDLLVPIEPEFKPLSCSYHFLANDYTCTMQSVETSNDNAIFRVEGTHVIGWANHEVRRLRIQNSNISFIVTRLFDVFQHLTSFQLIRTHLKAINPSDFDRATTLKEIDITGASDEFISLEENSFRSLEKLENLQLSGNHFHVIHQNAFASLSNLESLQLDNNKVSNLDIDMMKPLVQLRVFTINNNNLEMIEREIFSANPHLHTIEVENNFIIRMEQGFIDCLESLRVFKFSSNRCADASFGSSARFAFSLEQIHYELKQCYANINLLDPIEPEIIGLVCSYVFEGNDYTCTMRNVVTSNDNAIFRVSGTHIVGWANHEVLRWNLVSSNVTFVISRVFHIFLNLKTLRHVGSLTRIEKNDFVNAGRLRTLQVEEGSIIGLDADVFSLLNLQTLVITGSKLRFINFEAFTGLSNLTELNLATNYIDQLDPRVFEPLKELRTLSLQANSLTKLDAQIFSFNEKLESINIDNNQILEIGIGFIDHLSSLRVLRIAENQCANAVFGFGHPQPFNKELIDYELQHCYNNVGNPNPISPIIVPLTCSFGFQGVDYTCSLRNIALSDETAILRVGGVHVNGWADYEVKTVQIINSNATFIISRLFVVFFNVELFYQANGIQQVRSSDFIHARQLRTLIIAGVTSTVLEDRVFEHLTKLKSLHFVDGDLTTINEANFIGLDQLVEFHLEANSLSQIDPNSFNWLTKLEILVMSNNNLQSVGNWFTNNLELRTIDLRTNRITSISPYFIDGLDVLSSLQLSGNICVDLSFGPTNFNRTQVHQSLQNCYNSA